MFVYILKVKAYTLICHFLWESGIAIKGEYACTAPYIGTNIVLRYKLSITFPISGHWDKILLIRVDDFLERNLCSATAFALKRLVLL